MFSTVGGYGSSVGQGGGRVRAGHVHGLESSRPGDVSVDMFDNAEDVFRNAPILGKSSPMIPSSLQACLERNKQSIFSAI